MYFTPKKVRPDGDIQVTVQLSGSADTLLRELSRQSIASFVDTANLTIYVPASGRNPPEDRFLGQIKDGETSDALNDIQYFERRLTVEQIKALEATIEGFGDLTKRSGPQR